MFDGIKIQDLSVSADTNGRPALLTHDRLTFPLPVDEQTGAVIDRPRRADDRGLTFTLTPRQSGAGYRVEMKGSIHRHYNEGLHNADDFTANNLLTALDQVVTTYGVNPFLSRLNNVEFGVNARLPFPVARVLDNLVSYKNRSFYLDTRSDTPYYQCETQRYLVKLYDKGAQYGLDAHVLRVEVKVEKMEYLTRQGIYLNTLSDLLTVTNYGRLGALLVDTFTEIVFDAPTINTAALTPTERSLYQNGRNPKYWHVPKGLTQKEANTHRQRLHRAEPRYRALLDRYGGGNWQSQTATLIGQTWERLTTVDDPLLTRISEHRAAWKNLIKPEKNPLIDLPENSENAVRNAPETCHELTGGNRAVYCDVTAINPLEECHELTAPSEPEMSQINPLYLVLKCDTLTTPFTTKPGTLASQPPGLQLPANVEAKPGVCAVTGVPLMADARRFVSAAMLRNDPALLDQLTGRFTYYRKGSKEDAPTRTAHNVRNAESNRRNNLRRRLQRVTHGRDGQQQFLFPLAEGIHLTDSEQAALDYWKGTRFEISF